MTGETKEDISGWTTDTLHAHVSRMLFEIDRRYEQRFTDAEVRQQQRYEDQVKAIDAAMIAQRTAIDAAMLAADKATTLFAQTAKEKFETVNEFRGTLTDQAATFIPRKEVEAIIDRINEHIAAISARLDKFAEKALVMSEYDRISTMMNLNAERLTRIESKGKGVQASWGVAVVIVTIMIAAIGLYISVKG